MDLKFSAVVKAVKIKVTETESGAVIRTCQLALVREFDTVLAAALGGDAKQARKALMSGGLTSCVIPISALDVTGTLVGEWADGKGIVPDGLQTISLPYLYGQKATAKATDEDEHEPSVTLEFETEWNEHAWMFLGRHAGVRVEVELKRRQEDLPGIEGSGRRRRKHADEAA